ncbi:MAG: chlorophyllide reductase [Candidatus Devosia euplotis]|nr:chlorophyllide reductase [Candidatus Devosia euplotis]
MIPVRTIAALLFAVTAVTAAQAAPTTSKGQISVAHVLEMVSLAKFDPVARTAVIAYLASVGEATGLMMSEARQRGAKPAHCSNSFNLDESAAMAALSAPALDQSQWTETAATPSIIADMFNRAGCRYPITLRKHTTRPVSSKPSAWCI